jgi:hypothetical protein
MFLFTFWFSDNQGTHLFLMKSGFIDKSEKFHYLRTKKRHCHPIAKKLTEPTSPHFTKSEEV